MIEQNNQAADVGGIEEAAKAIYKLMPGAEQYPWVEGGNSFKQDEARRYARAALASRPVPQAGELSDEQIEVFGLQAGIEAFQHKQYRKSVGQAMTAPEKDMLDAQMYFARAIQSHMRAAGVEAKDAERYLKEGETLLQRLEREIKDSEALGRLLATERARLEFLHSNNKDADGWEWGVARMRVVNGKVEFLWGLSDHSDIDAAIVSQGTEGGDGK